MRSHGFCRFPISNFIKDFHNVLEQNMASLVVVMETRADTRPKVAKKAKKQKCHGPTDGPMDRRTDALIDGHTHLALLRGKKKEASRS